jgi:molecular chaperone GrpE (heat shock protein)
MGYQTEVKLPKWPFFLGNIVMLLLAWVTMEHGARADTSHWNSLFVATCGLIGAAISITPFLLEHYAAVRLAETGALVSTVEEIRNLELLAVQINAATARWQMVQEHSTNSVTAAREIAEKMGAEASAFTEFLQKSNDSEKANLRLEVEKLRRMESEWVQIIVRMLDHVYALYRAAERSGQPGLIDQLARFQESCRDVARRIGLIALEAKPDELFDRELHHAPEAGEQIPKDAKVQDTIATGYTYQGRRIRPVLVAVQGSEANGPANPPAKPARAVSRKDPSPAPAPTSEKDLL